MKRIFFISINSFLSSFQLETMYKIAHMSSFNIAIQAFMLLFQVKNVDFFNWCGISYQIWIFAGYGIWWGSYRSVLQCILQKASKSRSAIHFKTWQVSLLSTEIFYTWFWTKVAKNRHNFLKCFSSVFESYIQSYKERSFFKSSNCFYQTSTSTGILLVIIH